MGGPGPPLDRLLTAVWLERPDLSSKEVLFKALILESLAKVSKSTDD